MSETIHQTENYMPLWYTVQFYPMRGKRTREFMAEFLGTFTFLTLGMFGNVWAETTCQAGVSIFLPFIWGTALAIGIFVSGGYSGASLNPAVTLAVMTTNFTKKRRIGYMFAAQYLAALFASAVVTSMVYEFLLHKFGNDFENEPEVREIFLPTILDTTEWWEYFFDAFLSSFFFCYLLTAITDSTNLGINRFLYPVFSMIAMTVVNLAFGTLNGNTINPIQEVSPRIVCGLLGIDGVGDHFFIVILNFISLHAGGVLGMMGYDHLLGRNKKELYGDRAVYPANMYPTIDEPLAKKMNKRPREYVETNFEHLLTEEDNELHRLAVANKELYRGQGL